MTDYNAEKEHAILMREKSMFNWHELKYECLRLELDTIKFYAKWTFVMVSSLLGGFIAYVIGEAFK